MDVFQDLAVSRVGLVKAFHMIDELPGHMATLPRLKDFPRGATALRRLLFGLMRVGADVAAARSKGKRRRGFNKNGAPQ
jgi:hypothetical protein